MHEDGLVSVGLINVDRETNQQKTQHRSMQTHIHSSAFSVAYSNTYGDGELYIFCAVSYLCPII